MKTKQFRFPTGETGSELLYFMGIDWKEEKTTEQRSLIAKCVISKTISLNKDEAELLYKEVVNAWDIKDDHVG